MKRVATAVVLIAVVLIAVFKAPPFLFTLLVALVSLVALREYLALMTKQGLAPMPGVAYGMFVIWFGFLFAFCLFEFLKGSAIPDALGIPIAAAFVLVGATPIVAAFFLRSADIRTTLPSTASTIFGFIYLALPFTYLLALQAEPGGWLLLIFLFIVVWSGDIAAYYVGRSLGKHKLAPRISPGKTWEGAIASLVGSVILGAVWVHFSTPFFLRHWPKWCCGTVSVLYPSDIATWMLLKRGSFILVVSVAAITNIFSQLGDLFESAIKRAAEVKDSGALLPGHGGILDRVDAMLFATPVFYFFLLILFH